MKKKNIINKRILPLLLTVAMLIGAVPFVGVSASAATSTDYDIPTAGDVAWVKASSYAMEDGTVQDNSGTPSGAYKASDDGERHSIRNITFREAGYGKVNPNYDPNLQLYCIEYGKGYSSNPKYTAYAPSEHAYWMNQTEIEREGVMLSIGFGYPATPLEDLGEDVQEGDAIAATQILVWEFDAGYRTSYTGDADNSVLYDSCIEGTDAEEAYWTILTLANEYVNKRGYSFEYLEEQSEFVLFALEDAQTVMVYALPGEPITHEEKGAIEVYKKDPNGKNLGGAEFSVIDNDGNIIGKIGPTNSSGYDKIDEIPFGTYLVVETVSPAGHVKTTETWTVTLDENTPNGVVTINAVNEQQTTTYTPTVKKRLENAMLKEGQFSFMLTEPSSMPCFPVRTSRTCACPIMCRNSI